MTSVGGCANIFEDGQEQECCRRDSSSVAIPSKWFFLDWCKIHGIFVDASTRATLRTGRRKWGIQRRENFFQSKLSLEEFLQLSAGSSGSAAQVFEHWQKDTYEEMPQVAPQGRGQPLGAWSILAR
jgi:hypothetical protein